MVSEQAIMELSGTKPRNGSENARDHGIGDESDKEGDDENRQGLNQGGQFLNFGGEFPVVAFGTPLERDGQIATLFAHGDDVAEDPGKKWRVAEGAGKRGPFGHAFHEFDEETLEIDISGRPLEKGQSVEQGDAIKRKGGQGLTKFREEFTGHHLADDWDAEGNAVPGQLPFRGAPPGPEGESQTDQHQPDQPPIVSEEFTHRDEQTGHEGKFLSGLAEQNGQLREEKHHEDEKQDDAGGKDDAGINERGTDFATQFDDHGEVVGLTAEDAGEGSGGFAGGDHAAKEFGKAASMPEGGGKAGAVPHPLAEGGGDLPEDGGFFPGFDDLEGGLQLQAGLEQLGQFLGEKQEIIGRDAALEIGGRGGRWIGAGVRGGAIPGKKGDRTKPPGDQMAIGLGFGPGFDDPVFEFALGRGGLK